ncbi:MAG: hypothetical protein K0R90_569 [Oscillospiraceae bacterium]|nr:hypothetical protein [Oscillospiraceae bacterium]
MELISVPTCKEIYIEVNGKKLAVACGYEVETVRTFKDSYEFGSNGPIQRNFSNAIYKLHIKRVFLNRFDSGDFINFYNLAQINVVVVKPHKNIVYQNCEWTNIKESMELNKQSIETVELVSTSRVETTR